MLLLRIHGNLPSASTPEAKQCNLHTMQPKQFGTAGFFQTVAHFQNAVLASLTTVVELNGTFLREILLQRFPLAPPLCGADENRQKL